MKNSIISLLAFVVILATACSKESLRGEGPVNTDYRTSIDLNGLKTVKINGSSDVHISYGDNYTLAIKGYGNLVGILQTTVKNKVLTVEFPNNYNVRNDNTEIFLTVPTLPNLQINGSADANLSGIFPAQESIDFSINGSSKIDASEVNMNANFAKYQISGSGNINTPNLISKTCECSISGSGKITASVFEFLKARINGSGEIYYQGSPTVDSEISGSGKVRKL